MDSSATRRATVGGQVTDRSSGCRQRRTLDAGRVCILGCECACARGCCACALSPLCLWTCVGDVPCLHPHPMFPFLSIRDARRAVGHAPTAAAVRNAGYKREENVRKPSHGDFGLLLGSLFRFRERHVCRLGTWLFFEIHAQCAGYRLASGGGSGPLSGLVSSSAGAMPLTPKGPLPRPRAGSGAEGVAWP